MNYEKFKQLYGDNNINNLNFKIKKFKYTIYSWKKKLTNYSGCLSYFKNEFPNIS